MKDNLIDFPNNKDFSYILGDKNKGEPEIVGVSGECSRMELTPDLRDFIINGALVNRSELIALILVTGLCEDVEGKSNQGEITLNLEKDDVYMITRILNRANQRKLKNNIHKQMRNQS